MIGSYWAMSLFFSGSIAGFYYFRYGNVDAKQLYLPMKFRWTSPSSHTQPFDTTIPFFDSSPFDESTIMGWFYVFVAELISASVYGFCNVSIVAFFMSMGMYFSACRLHFQAIFAEMNDTVNHAVVQNVFEMEWKLEQSLITAVRYQNSIKEWVEPKTKFIEYCGSDKMVSDFSLFNISSELISGTIFFQLFIGILHMSATYFEMELVWR